MKYLASIFCFITLFASAQNITPSVINGTGRTFQTSYGGMDVNIGEPITGLISNGTNQITQGFLQPCIVYNSIEVAICAEDSMAIVSGGGYYVNTAGTYYDTLQTASGCDSVLTILLSVNPVYSSTLNTSFCSGGSFMLPDSTIVSATGTYLTVLQTVDGCDSTITTNVTVLQNTSSIETVIACDSYTWNSQTYTQSGTYTFNAVNADGCDSVATLNLTIIILSVTATPSGSIHCFGGTVSVNVSANGGTSPYIGTGSFNQAAVTQIYIVSDANGCSSSDSLTLTEPNKVEGTTTTSPANCGLTNGTATVIPAGGTGTYSYLWSDGLGQITATASSLDAGTYSVTITDGNSCTGTASATVAGVGVLPDPAGAISGAAGACRNTCIVYIVPPVSGANSYSWTLPPGATGSSSTNSITLCFDNTYSGGFLCVTASNTCGSSAQSCINIPALTVRPAQPGFIIGNQHPCGPNIISYSIPASNNALNYNWSVTGSGVAILSGQGSNSVQVSIPTGFGQGSVSVNASNCIGTTSTRNFFLTGIPTHSGVLVGPSYVCANTNNVSYSINPVIGSSAYSWSVTGDMSIASSSGTSSLVNFGPAFTTGTISVTTSSPCGAFTRFYTIRSVPMQPGNIYGPGANLCEQTGVTYSLDPVASATSYSWTVPAGVDITLNSGTSITVNFGPSFTSGNICVSANNACGSSVARCYNVTAVPAVPTAITGPASVCKSSVINYTVSPVAGATFYSWFASNGVLINPIGTGLSADANFSLATANSTVITVRANNNCGISQPVNKTVSIDLNCREAKEFTLNEEEFIVYPNPTRGKITVEFNQATKGTCNLKVVDLLGNVLQMAEVKAEVGLNILEMDLGSVSNGMYFIVMERDWYETETLRVGAIN